MSRFSIALFGFLAIIGYFLVTEHWAHVYGYFPYVLLLACPLLHIFGHGGHSGHRGHGDGDAQEKKSSSLVGHSPGSEGRSTSHHHHE